jgi:hypothetical protein
MKLLVMQLSPPSRHSFPVVPISWSHKVRLFSSLRSKRSSFFFLLPPFSVFKSVDTWEVTLQTPWHQDLCNACFPGKSVTRPTDEIDSAIILRTCRAIAPAPTASCGPQHKTRLAHSSSTKRLTSFGRISNSCCLATRRYVVRSIKIKTSLYF